MGWLFVLRYHPSIDGVLEPCKMAVFIPFCVKMVIYIKVLQIASFDQNMEFYCKKNLVFRNPFDDKFHRFTFFEKGHFIIILNTILNTTTIATLFSCYMI